MDNYLAFSCAATLHVIMFFFVSEPHKNPQFHMETHKTDQTEININGFDMAKPAAQLLYGPVLVLDFLGTNQTRSANSIMGSSYNFASQGRQRAGIPWKIVTE